MNPNPLFDQDEIAAAMAAGQANADATIDKIKRIRAAEDRVIAAAVVLSSSESSDPILIPLDNAVEALLKERAS